MSATAERRATWCRAGCGKKTARRVGVCHACEDVLIGGHWAPGRHGVQHWVPDKVTT